ncbi:MAG TPA: sugar ABC transporter permease [Clostridiaceae bacterium]|nr:sugar ABC transporter permease [Clostridiaceae bacterium]
MKKKNGILYELNKNKVKFLMIMPAVLYFFIMCYVPMTGIVLAFKNYTYTGGIFKSPWVGFNNFKFFFNSGKAFLVTKNTILYNIAFLIINNFLQITVAIILSELAGKCFKKISQSLMFLPYFISWVVVGAFIYNLFNYEFGAVNTLLNSMGMEPIDVYSNPSAWKYILVAVSAWKWVGYGSVLYLAAILGIDSEIYEAADIDGANIFKKIWHITLPSLKATVIILLLLSLGNIMKGDFQMFYQVVGNNGLVLDATDVIDTYVVRSLMDLQEFGMTAAAGLYQSVLSLFIILGANKLIKIIDNDYALF